MDNKSTYGLRLDQMANLLAMGAEAADSATDGGENEALGTLLREQLNCTQPKGSLLRDTLVMMLNDTGRKADPLATKPLGEVLLSPQSDIDLLVAIKECSKTLSCSLDCRTETALARTAYFAAIAAALVHHEAKITQNTYETLAESFTLLMEKGWMARELVDLFSQARRICRQRLDGA